MSKWLDTETKALLQQVPPEKCAPPVIGTFTLVLLEKGKDRAWVERSLAKVPGISNEKASNFMSQACPLPIAGGLLITDALLGQFELVCSDSVSIFLSDDVVSSGGRYYLSDLYAQICSSSEFESLPVQIDFVPESDLGRRFVDQFLGGVADAALCGVGGHAYRGTMMRKKARIMNHWAKKIGAQVAIGDDE